MSESKHVSERLYDFLSELLPEAERAAVAEHLARCSRCAAERTKVEQALKILNAERFDPPQLPEGYWQAYWVDVETRLRASSRRYPVLQRLLDLVRPSGGEQILSPKIAYGLLGFALGIIVAAAVLSPYLGRKDQSGATQMFGTHQDTSATEMESAPLISTTREFSEPLIQFFQKAKTFLIGVKNLDERTGVGRDLATERTVSKQLAAECRVLKRQPLDPRVQQLLSELDVVLVQLSKVKDEGDSLKLDLVKEGIESNNLLMKIRVQELAHEARLQQAVLEGSGTRKTF
jgi:hypothetical protein